MDQLQANAIFFIEKSIIARLIYILSIVDPAVLEKVDGLNPQQEKHEFFMHFFQVFIFQNTVH